MTYIAIVMIFATALYIFGGFLSTWKSFTKKHCDFHKRAYFISLLVNSIVLTGFQILMLYTFSRNGL